MTDNTKNKTDIELLIQHPLLENLQSRAKNITNIERLAYINLIIIFITLTILITITGMSMYIYIIQKPNLQKISYVINSVSDDDIFRIINAVKTVSMLAEELNITDSSDIIKVVSEIGILNKTLLYFIQEMCKFITCG